MFDKIIIYGDSFSNPACCLTDDREMWYRYVFPEYPDNKFINRTKSGNSPGAMFLQAGHDCLTNRDPIMMVIALGPLRRLPTYTDGWYGDEKLKDINLDTAAERFPLPPRSTDLQDCLQYFDRYSSQRSTADTMDLFHPTLLWSTMYDNVIKLNALAEKYNHDTLVLHMSHTHKEYTQRHPLVSIFENGASRLDYINEEHSCTNVCKKAKIKPWDFDKYEFHGHHSKEGQEYFGKYIKKLWN